MRYVYLFLVTDPGAASSSCSVLMGAALVVLMFMFTGRDELGKCTVVAEPEPLEPSAECNTNECIAGRRDIAAT